MSSKRHKKGRPAGETRGEPLERRFGGLRLWVIRTVIFVLLTALYQHAVRRTVFFTGDEPHYLMTVLSLRTDGDFDETNNYANGGTARVGYPALPPQTRTADGRVLPEHGPGFPLFLVIPAMILDFSGLKYFLLAVMLAAALLLCATADRLRGNQGYGTMAGLVLILLPVWQVYGPRIYPEVTAGCLALLIYFIVTKAEPGSWSTRVVGLLIGILPILYLRFSSFALFLFVIALLNPRIRRRPGFFLSLGAALTAGALLIFSIYGSDWHRAAPGSTGLTFDGFGERFWRLWFDRAHGIAVANPILLLLFWAVPKLCFRAIRNLRLRPIAGLGLMLFGYACECAVARAYPGESHLGRFLCAICPAALLVSLSWIEPAGRILLTRAIPALALAGVSAAIIFDGIWNQRPAWLSFAWYQDRFPIGWLLSSFIWQNHARTEPSTPLGEILLAVWALTSSSSVLIHFLKTRKQTILQSTKG
jgi:hypothetical protein